MATWFMALLVAIGGGTWTWNKTMKETNRQDTSLIVGFAVGLVIFIVIFTLVKFVIS